MIVFISFDLPQLTTFEIRSVSLHNVSSLSISRIIKVVSVSDVPFINGNYSAKQAFAFIEPDSVICDEGLT